MSDELYICPYTKKRFKSLAAFANHTNSRKFRQLAARAAPSEGEGEGQGEADGAQLASTYAATLTDARPARAGQLEWEREEGEEEREEEEDAQLAAAIAASLAEQEGGPATESSIDGENTEDEEQEGEGEEYECAEDVPSDQDEEHQQMIAAAIQASLLDQKGARERAYGAGTSYEAGALVDGLPGLHVGQPGLEHDREQQEWLEWEGGEESSDEWASDQESEWEEDWDSDGPEEAWEVNMCESLFDGHVSESFEANVAYMKKEQSFFVPDLCTLDDPRGLYTYLQEKICRRHTCLCCNRVFGGVEACRSHMRDVSHCRINFERDEIALELAAGAFQLASVSITSKVGDAQRAATTGSAFVDREKTELVLPNGHRLGHRSLKHFYRQKRQDGASDSLVPHTASLRHMQAKIALREEAKERNMVLRRSAGLALHGASKAMSANYTHKPDAADNKHARAIVHHWGAGGGGSHYHMAGSRQYQKGQKVKGVVLRHSRQGARLQAARNKANRSDSSVAVLR